MEEAQDLLKDVIWCQNAYETMDGSDALVIVTEWNEFRALDLGRVKELLSAPVLVDFRNIYNSDEMEEAGFNYYSLGRPRSSERALGPVRR